MEQQSQFSLPSSQPPPSPKTSAAAAPNPVNQDMFLHPERIVASFGLQPGNIAADFGAGHGYFAIPLARAVGSEGKVYAFDIQRDELAVIRTKAQLDHLLQLQTVWADLEEEHGSRLNDASVHFVLITNILFQAEERNVVVQEAYRLLKPGGKMAIIEWNAREHALGPQQDLRITSETASSLATEAGFQLEQEFDTGAHHYGLMFVKK